MPPTSYSPEDLPLVITAPGSPVHDLLAPGDAESNEMTAAIWADFRGEIIRRVECLPTNFPGPQELREELHAIRGICAQFGFFLLETLLFAWEKKEPDPLLCLQVYLRAAVVASHLSVAAIERDFPHLRAGEV